jgi:hydroxyethylthiazole kinase
VHNITNHVVMNFTANALLALGASPVMAHAAEEVEEMVGLAGALVLNIGTLSPAWVESMVLAGKAARRRGIPVVLDPVGCGATRFRTETALRLLREVGPTIVRGNASEIMALAGAGGATRGVDSTLAADAAVEGAAALAERWRCAVAVSGAVDVIVGDGATFRVHNGHPMMPRVTGLGCAASALTGAFAAVNRKPASAAANALVITGLAGEMAAAKAEGPGSLALHFLDALYRLTSAEVRDRGRLESS